MSSSTWAVFGDSRLTSRARTFGLPPRREGSQGSDAGPEKNEALTCWVTGGRVEGGLSAGWGGATG